MAAVLSSSVRVHLSVPSSSSFFFLSNHHTRSPAIVSLFAALKPPAFRDFAQGDYRVRCGMFVRD